jgi:hypothetical protein
MPFVSLDSIVLLRVDLIELIQVYFMKYLLLGTFTE